MKKETLADKFARKSFESAGIQKSWQMHMQAFGPILGPAFPENFQARIHLTNALNHISTRDIRTGLKKLRLVEKFCETDADKAAWLFCMGLCMEIANIREQMVVFYRNAGKYGHHFYLPYLKIAKAAHNDAVFEVAEENYLKAIEFLNEDRENEQNKIVLGTAYTNYASCLTMMHRYDEAEQALMNAKEVFPDQKGRAATEAILAAARGEEEKVGALLERIEAQEPMFYETTNKMANEILEKKHPHFTPISLKEGWTTAFWDWFFVNENTFLEKLDEQDYDAVFAIIQSKLKEVFPFMERNPEFAIEPRENYCQITFADFFMASLEQAYKELIGAVPAYLSEKWSVDMVH